MYSYETITEPKTKFLVSNQGLCQRANDKLKKCLNEKKKLFKNPNNAHLFNEV